MTTKRLLAAAVVVAALLAGTVTSTARADGASLTVIPDSAYTSFAGGISFTVDSMQVQPLGCSYWYWESWGGYEAWCHFNILNRYVPMAEVYKYYYWDAGTGCSRQFKFAIRRLDVPVAGMSYPWRWEAMTRSCRAVGQ
jgi:hypothetical protein